MAATARIGIFIAAISLALPATAQSTVQQLLDAGGRSLTTDETRNLLGNAKMSGENGAGYPIAFDMKADGTFQGYVYPTATPLAVWGKWHVNETGAYCQQMRYPGGGTNDFCNSLFVLNGKYFAAGTGKNPRAGPAGRLYPRAFAPM